MLRADRIVVHKERREMLLLHRGSLLRSYRIALGRAPLGHKAQEGDGRTPEGQYFIDRRNPEERLSSLAAYLISEYGGLRTGARNWAWTRVAIS